MVSLHDESLKQTEDNPQVAMAAHAAAEAAVRKALDIATKRVLLRQVNAGSRMDF